MKKKNIYLADILALILLISLIFAPFINLNSYQDLKTTSMVFFMAYMAFLFLNLPKGRPLIFLLPLILYSFLIFYVFRGASFSNNKEVYKDFIFVLKDNFPIISLSLAFYVVERILTKLFGSYFTIFAGILCLVIYLTSSFTNLWGGLKAYKAYILYLFVFLVFRNLNYKRKFKSPFYILSIILVAFEIYIYYSKDLYIGFFISPLLLLYVVFAKEKKVRKTNFEKFFIFSIIFLFPTIKYAMSIFLHMRPLALSLSSLIISFFVSVILFEAKIKALSSISLGLS